MRSASSGKRRISGLALAALGIVFGDIGTSPLYSMQATFAPDGGGATLTREHVFGVISLVFWSITIIVTCKCVLLVLRADHQGEGGILSLATLVRRHVAGKRRLGAIAAMAGVVGACLFFGDSVITPAISVLSAVEGLEVAAPGLEPFVVPAAVGILLALFALQRYGTAGIGVIFGPTMLLWFVLLAVLGLPHVIAHPEILAALSPTHAIGFIAEHPPAALIALGSIVLVVTGAEALYADLGHFGRRAIRLAWLAVVFPALIVNYLGQGAHLLASPESASNPFFTMAPSWATFPLVIAATAATVIASQSVISGAYSVAMQAIRLGMLPRLEVHQTSSFERGQIYLPTVNTILAICVLVVVIMFRSSGALAAAYGFAVTATFVVTTVLLLVAANRIWGWNIAVCALIGVPLLALEGAYFLAGTLKLVAGAWLPVVIAAALMAVMLTWRRGQRIVSEERRMREGPLLDLLAHFVDNPPARTPGTVVYLHGRPGSTPLALRINLRLNRVVHERCVFASVVPLDVAHVDEADRITLEPISIGPSGMYRAIIRRGFADEVDVPALLRSASKRLEPDGGDDPFCLEHASYVLTHIDLQPASTRGFGSLRDRLFVTLARAASSPSDHYRLPFTRTIELGVRMQV